MAPQAVNQSESSNKTIPVVSSDHESSKSEVKREEKIEAPKTSHDHDHSAHDHSGNHDHSDHNHGPTIDKPELLKSEKHETTGSHTSHESGKEHVIKATSHASAKTTTWLPAILLAAFLVVFIVSRV